MKLVIEIDGGVHDTEEWKKMALIHISNVSYTLIPDNNFFTIHHHKINLRFFLEQLFEDILIGAMGEAHAYNIRLFPQLKAADQVAASQGPGRILCHPVDYLFRRYMRVSGFKVIEFIKKIHTGQTDRAFRSQTDIDSPV